MKRLCSNILKSFFVVLFFSAGFLNAQENKKALFDEAASSLNLVIQESGDILFPEEYADAAEHYKAAIKYNEKNKSPLDIQVELEKVISILTKINDSVEERAQAFSTVLGARNAASKSNSQLLAANFWTAGEDKFDDAIESYADKNYDMVQEKIPPILDNYYNAMQYADYANNLMFNWRPLKAADESLAGLLSPLSYSQGAAKLDKILVGISDGEKMDEIKTSVDEAAALFNKATEGAQKFSGAYSGLMRIRKDAESAGAQIYSSELWNAAEEMLSETASYFEKDKIEKAADRSLDASLKYLDAKHLATRNKILSKEDELLKLALSEQADKYAPKTFNESKALAQSVSDMIYSDNYDYSNLKLLAAQAESKALLSINIARIIKDVDSGKNAWEDFILAWNIFGNKETTKDEFPSPPILPLTKEGTGVATTKKIPPEVANTFNPGEAEIIENGDELIIRLSGLKFQWLGYTIDDNAKKILDKAIQVLNYFPSSTITVAGHNDYVAARTFNQEISQRRADNVRAYILEHSDFDPKKIVAIGYGETMPITNDKTFEGRERNRRIELIIK